MLPPKMKPKNQAQLYIFWNTIGTEERTPVAPKNPGTQGIVPVMIATIAAIFHPPYNREVN